EATSVLASESASIVKAMGIIQQASREGNFSVTDLNQMANTLSHESALLNQELSRFHLPTPNQGGRITTSTVLWQRLTFDPVDISANALGFIAKAVHATLVRYGEGAEMVPGLAERWEVLDQGMGYRFHLRRGAHFHNGRPIEAAAVRDSFLRVLSPDLKSSGSWILRSVRGASDVLSGKAKIAAGLIVRDSHTIDIMLEEPLAFFLSLLTMHQVSIVPVEETHDREHFRLHASGAGPFRIVEAEDGRVVRLQKNADYWVQGEPYVDELVFRLDLHSSRDVAQAFLDGELDIAHSLPLNIAAELRKDSRYAPYMSNTIQLHTSYLAWDCTSEPFNRAEVRQAINYAIDRRRINEQVYAGLGMVAPSLLPPGLLGYDPNLRGFEYDPDRARTLLRQAGLGAGFTIEYRTWDSDEFNNSGLVPCIVEDLAAIGIRVDVNRYGAIEARAPLARRGHGLLFCGNWYADFPDSDNFFYVFFHSDSTATAGIYYNSPELDGQITAARRSNDLEERAAIYRKLDEMVIREAPIACLFHERFFVIHKPEVRGLKTSLVPPPVRYHVVWVEE
ncbi:MAG TPA: ABC transporter substrate-binding protein, partial [Thermoanaerobaculia bacterium]|nr:ABC transporter substrate-binding protein [Thermoanaerobaculia bacterium]